MGISGEINLAILRLWEKTPVYLHSQTSFPHSVLNTGHMGDEEAQPSKLLTGCVHILNNKKESRMYKCGHLQAHWTPALKNNNKIL